MNHLLRIRDALAAKPWEMWTAQVLAILRIDLKKNFLSRRGVWIYLLAFAPVLIIGLHAFVGYTKQSCNLEEDTKIFNGIFQLFYLRFGIFFGSMGIFTWLFRGEIVERSLHYYFLAPVRREILVLGKFLAGSVTAIFFFGASVALSFWVMYGHLGQAGSYFVFSGPGLGHFFAYLRVTILACVGYGSMFLALSLLSRNPALPAGVMLGWETFSGVLPSIMQKLSVTYYLKHLCPVPLQMDGFLALFTVVADPIAPWLAVTGLLSLTAVVVVLACLRVRTMEISYAVD